MNKITKKIELFETEYTYFQQRGNKNDSWDGRTLFRGNQGDIVMYDMLFGGKIPFIHRRDTPYRSVKDALNERNETN